MKRRPASVDELYQLMGGRIPQTNKVRMGGNIVMELSLEGNGDLRIGMEKDSAKAGEFWVDENRVYFKYTFPGETPECVYRPGFLGLPTPRKKTLQLGDEVRFGMGASLDFRIKGIKGLPACYIRSPPFYAR